MDNNIFIIIIFKIIIVNLFILLKILFIGGVRVKIYLLESFV